MAARGEAEGVRRDLRTAGAQESAAAFRGHRNGFGAVHNLCTAPSYARQARPPGAPPRRSYSSGRSGSLRTRREGGPEEKSGSGGRGGLSTIGRFSTGVRGPRLS